MKRNPRFQSNLQSYRTPLNSAVYPVRTHQIVPAGRAGMPGSTSAKAMVGALCDADGAGDDGNRTGSVSAAAGEELGSRSTKRKKGCNRARADRVQRVVKALLVCMSSVCVVRFRKSESLTRAAAKASPLSCV